MTGPETEAAGGSLRDLAVSRRLADRRAVAEDEVRRLIDAGLALMRDDPTGNARIADIVRRAGVSNDVFYRSFGGKDELMAAVSDDGARRLISYVRHARDKAPDPAGQIRLCVTAIMHQADDPEAAATARTVLRHVGRAPGFRREGGVDVQAGLGEVLGTSFAALGSADPARDGMLAAGAALMLMQRYLWAGRPPAPADVDHLLDWILRAVTPPPGRRAARTRKTP
jgi:AcrR family transcriptional regulator